MSILLHVIKLLYSFLKIIIIIVIVIIITTVITFCEGRLCSVTRLFRESLSSHILLSSDKDTISVVSLIHLILGWFVSRLPCTFVSLFFIAFLLEDICILFKFQKQLFENWNEKFRKLYMFTQKFGFKLVDDTTR